MLVLWARGRASEACVSGRLFLKTGLWASHNKVKTSDLLYVKLFRITGAGMASELPNLPRPDATSHEGIPGL